MFETDLLGLTASGGLDDAVRGGQAGATPYVQAASPAGGEASPCTPPERWLAAMGSTAAAKLGPVAAPDAGLDAVASGPAAPQTGAPAEGRAAEQAAADSPLYGTDDFRINCYKVMACSRRAPHDWKGCPFVHPGEHGRRRPLSIAQYEAVMCPAVRRGEPCPAGDTCNKAHNVFEMWLHPDRYRTQICIQGMACTRKICFFAHTPEELRRPPRPASSAGRPSARHGAASGGGAAAADAPCGASAGGGGGGASAGFVAAGPASGQAAGSPGSSGWSTSTAGGFLNAFPTGQLAPAGLSQQLLDLIGGSGALLAGHQAASAAAFAAAAAAFGLAAPASAGGDPHGALMLLGPAASGSQASLDALAAGNSAGGHSSPLGAAALYGSAFDPSVSGVPGGLGGSPSGEVGAWPPPTLQLSLGAWSASSS